MKTLNYLAFILLTGMMISACSEENASRNSFSVRLTDDPAPYSAVYIDIQGVEVMSHEGEKTMLTTNKGVYNLLELSNGKEALIASGELDMKRIRQIRLILGPQNSMVQDNITYTLSQPEVDDPGLIIPVDARLEPGAPTSILLDFDANRSITTNHPNNYKFQPVLRAVDATQSGIIKGRMIPGAVLASVRAVTKESFYYSSVNAEGYFTIKGLPPGTYSVSVLPAAPYTSITVSDVQVTAGATVNVGEFYL
jgi:hypothetical protein